MSRTKSIDSVSDRLSDEYMNLNVINQAVKDW